jgi:hypothetical protein
MLGQHLVAAFRSVSKRRGGLGIEGPDAEQGGMFREFVAEGAVAEGGDRKRRPFVAPIFNLAVSPSRTWQGVGKARPLTCRSTRGSRTRDTAARVRLFATSSSAPATSDPTHGRAERRTRPLEREGQRSGRTEGGVPARRWSRGTNRVSRPQQLGPADPKRLTEPRWLPLNLGTIGFGRVRRALKAGLAP